MNRDYGRLLWNYRRLCAAVERDDCPILLTPSRRKPADLQAQAAYDVRYLRYWVDEGAGRVFCLVEAPSAEAAANVHREAHGLVADHIYRVQEGS